MLVCLGLGTAASADDNTPPRAAAVPRALARSFGSYADLVAYASSVAVEQGRLDARLDAVRAQLAASSADTSELQGRWTGAALASRTERARTEEQRLIADGALPAPKAEWSMPSVGEITQAFGPTDIWVEPAREYGGVAYAHFHDGVDIAGGWAEPVYAPARGRVVFVGLMADGAEVVVLAHDDGLVSLFAHLDAWSSPPPVRAGDAVAAGDRIGTVGLTGITFGQHLHWAVYRDGVVIDPLSLIAADRLPPAEATGD